ncbi:MAG: hypothetical protein GY725_17000 [bacterium]|nr:hypothetical protein [bacterium]
MNPNGPPAPRRDLRNPIRVECVRASGDKPFFMGYAGNLSETGVFINCMNPRPAGTRVRLVLHMPGISQRRFSSIAEVRWQRDYDGRNAPPSGMGLRFMELSTGVRSMLRVFCASNEPDTFRKLLTPA